MWINGGPNDAYVPSTPTYRGDHTYTFQITAPGGQLTFAVGNTNTGDNTGSFTIAIGSQPAGDIPWHPHYDFAMAAGLAASVDLADGHIDVRAAGVAVGGRGPGLGSGTSWDSARAQAGLMTVAGQGWLAGNLTARMDGGLTGTVLYTDGSGAQWPYTYQGGANDPGPTYSTYATPAGLAWVLHTDSRSSTAKYVLSDILTGEVRTFDGNGSLVSDADSYGYGDVLAPSGATPGSETNGNVQALGSGARSLLIAYSGGYLADVQSPAWRTASQTNGVPDGGQHVTYSYGPGAGCVTGQLCSITWAAGTAQALSATFQYTGLQLTGITTPGGHQWALTYTGTQLTKIVSPAEGATPSYTTTIAYATGGSNGVPGAASHTTLTRGVGFAVPPPVVSLYNLDAQGQALQIDGGLNRLVDYNYSANHVITGVVDGDQNVTAYYYNPAQQSSSVDLVYKVIRPSIARIAGGYPDRGTTVFTYGYDGQDNLNDVQNVSTGAPSQVTHYQYNTYHRVTSTVQWYRQNAGSDSWRGEIDGYDPATGDLTSRIYGKGVQVPDTAGPIPAPTPAQDATNAAAYTEGWVYDPATGDLTSHTVQSAAGAAITTMIYDGDGDLASAKPPVAGQRTYGYDHWGRQVQTKLAAVQVEDVPNYITFKQPTWATSYYGDGQVHVVTDPQSHPTSYSYDPLGRKLTITDPDNHITNWTYSATGLTQSADALGNATVYLQDAAGRTVQAQGPAGDPLHDPGSLLSGYHYDPADNTTSVVQGVGTPVPGATVAISALRSQAMTYDAQNTLIEQDLSGPGLGGTLATKYTPDPQGNTAGVQAPNGDLTVYSYSPADEQVGTSLRALGVGETASDGRRRSNSYCREVRPDNRR